MRAPTAVTVVRLRGGMGRIKNTRIEGKARESMLERFSSMGDEEIKSLARKAGKCSHSSSLL
jgi:hypothetical protein